MTVAPKPLLIRAGAIILVVVVAVLLNVWSSYEQRRSDDVDRVAQLSQVRESLHLYAINHNQYPALSQGRESIVVSQTLHCLSDEGFASLSTPACAKRNYLASFKGRYASLDLLDPFAYQPLNSDGSLCTSSAGCFGYVVPFELATNALFPKGLHQMTQNGVQ